MCTAVVLHTAVVLIASMLIVVREATKVEGASEPGDVEESRRRDASERSDGRPSEPRCIAVFLARFLFSQARCGPWILCQQNISYLLRLFVGQKPKTEASRTYRMYECEKCCVRVCNCFIPTFSPPCFLLKKKKK